MRAIALHTDVIATTSAIWQTNCVAVRSGDEAFLIDSPILPAELDALPTLFEQAGFPLPRGLLATHGDWDHLLGRLAFPGLALGCAESTATRMRSAPGEVQRELRSFDEELAIERPRPLALGAIQELPLPGHCGIGERELELHPTAGHTEDGMAVWIPWGRVLVVGDYLSAIELPSLAEHRGAPAGDPPTAAASGGVASPPAAGGAALSSAAGGAALSSAAGGAASPPAAGGAASSSAGGPLGAYRATLERLRPLAQVAAHVVPGHGPILDAARALDVLEEDLAYLLALQERGADAELPPGRRTRIQRARHAENVARAALSRSSAR